MVDIASSDLFKNVKSLQDEVIQNEQSVDYPENTGVSATDFSSSNEKLSLHSISYAPRMVKFGEQKSSEKPLLFSFQYSAEGHVKHLSYESVLEASRRLNALAHPTELETYNKKQFHLALKLPEVVNATSFSRGVTHDLVVAVQNKGEINPALLEPFYRELPTSDAA